MKKLGKQILAIVMALTLVVGTMIYSAPTDVYAAKGKVKSVKVTNLKTKSLTLKKGKSKVLKVKVTTTGKKVSKVYTVKSSNKKVVVAKKTKKGVKLTAKKKGTAKITIKSKVTPKKKTVIKVTVGTPVKSVKLNATAATLLKGATQQLTATVAPVKASNKEVVWSTSNSDVATVDSKGVVTAVGVGTVQITATATDGSGKSATCNITVVDPVTIQSASVLRYNALKVTLSKAQKLTVDNFKIMIRYMPEGSYVRTCKINKITTSDNINYYVILDSQEEIYEYDYVKISVTGLEGNTGTVEKEILYKNPVGVHNVYNVVGYYVGDEVMDTIYMYNGFGYLSSTWSALPAGLTAEAMPGGSDINITGTPTTVGTSTTVFTFKDEVGNTYNNNVTFVIGSDDKLVAASTPIYATTETDDKAYVWGDVYTVGGSGYYTYEVLDSTYDLSFDSDGYFDGYVKAGNYKVNVKVTDEFDDTLTTTVTIEFNVKKGIEVKGVVKEASGNPVYDANVMFEGKDTTDLYYGTYSAYTDENGQFTAYVPDGTYDIYALYGETESDYIYSEKITAAKSGYEFKLDLYRVTIGSNAEEFNSNFFGIWLDADDNWVGYGNTIYLKPGTYDIYSVGENFAYSYMATASFEVKGATSITADVEYEKVILDEIVVNEGITMYVDYYTNVYYSFIPETTGTYYFYSESGTDPCADLFNGEGVFLISGDDENDLQFSFEYECEAGKQYYLGVSSYEDYTDEISFVVSDTPQTL